MIPFEMRSTRIAISLVLLAKAVAAQGGRIRVEPNVLISRDPATSHAEMFIAAHPTDARKLIATSTVFIDAGGQLTNVFYGSSDGGQTWRDITPPHQRTGSSGDPWVGFSRSGAAMGIALVRGRRLEMWVYRAPDGGFIWTDSINAAWGDHERLGVDYGTGKFAGRMYLAGEYGDPNWDRSKPETRVSIVGVWRSDDEGKTWIGPVVAGTNRGGGLGVSAINVLSDGRVAIHLHKYPNPQSDLTTPNWDPLLAISDDGGVSFAPVALFGQKRLRRQRRQPEEQARGLE